MPWMRVVEELGAELAAGEVAAEVWAEEKIEETQKSASQQRVNRSANAADFQAIFMRIPSLENR